MTKLEKKILIIALAVLAAELFFIYKTSYYKMLINDSDNIINALQIKNKVYTNRIAALQDSIKKLQKKDTVIITRYKQKIDSVYVYNYYDYVVFYDTLLNTNVAAADTFLCFDSTTIATITKKLLEGERDSILLNNCIGELQLCDSINSEIERLSDVNKEKIKKLKRQRNTFAGATLLEFLVILGLISKI